MNNESLNFKFGINSEIASAIYTKDGMPYLYLIDQDYLKKNCYVDSLPVKWVSESRSGNCTVVHLYNKTFGTFVLFVRNYRDFDMESTKLVNLNW